MLDVIPDRSQGGPCLYLVLTTGVESRYFFQAPCMLSQQRIIHGAIRLHTCGGVLHTCGGMLRRAHCRVRVLSQRLQIQPDWDNCIGSMQH
jgi:hypothetical protein